MAEPADAELEAFIQAKLARSAKRLAAFLSLNAPRLVVEKECAMLVQAVVALYPEAAMAYIAAKLRDRYCERLMAAETAQEGVESS